MKVCGIDFSLSSPSLSIIDNGKLEGLYCIRATKKQEVNNPIITLLEYPIYKTEMERFDKLTSLILNFIPSDITLCYIENYAFGPSANMAFSIGECTGLMKYKYYKRFNQELYAVPPTVVKKFATKSGKATKRQMVDEFSKNEFDIYNAFCLVDDKLDKIKKPIDDICDAYWISKYAYEQVIMQESNKTK